MNPTLCQQCGMQMHPKPIGRWIPARPPSRGNPNVCEACDSGTVNTNTCPDCRSSMRLWALEYRRQTEPNFKDTCLITAKLFRDECLHSPDPADSPKPKTSNGRVQPNPSASPAESPVTQGAGLVASISGTEVACE